jgi:hypothetical protein
MIFRKQASPSPIKPSAVIQGFAEDNQSTQHDHPLLDELDRLAGVYSRRDDDYSRGMAAAYQTAIKLARQHIKSTR